MTTPESTATGACPDTERLACFIDGNLRDEERTALLRHISGCPECREMVLVADEIASSEAREGNVVQGRFRPRTVLTAAAAAAAVIAVLFVGPWRDDDMEKLAKAAGTLDARVNAARFSAEFPYRSQRTLRSGNGADAHYEIVEVASDVAARAEKAGSARSLHAGGVAYLLLGPEYRDRAVEALETARQKAPGDAAVLNDLSAAYIAIGDYGRALQAASESAALQESDAAAWNRALALRAMGRVEEAKSAWQHYLRLDPDSEWAKEARTYLTE